MCEEERRSVKTELKRMNTTGLQCSIAVLVGQGVHAVLVVRDELDTHLENRRACEGWISLQVRGSQETDQLARWKEVFCC